MTSKKYTITVIGGDGIGPEVIAQTINLLDASGLKFIYQSAAAGLKTFQQFGTPLPAETINLCRNSQAILFGAVTTPPHLANYFSPIVRLRKILHLYANIRPFFSLPLKSFRSDIDLVIFRENTEDLYTGNEKLTKDGAIAQRVITKKACINIIRAAFEYAKQHHLRKVTVIHKANILRLTDGLFLETAKKIATEFPDIQKEEMLVDNCALQLIKKPEQFEVIVTTNMFGDILSDEAAALVGGLGVVASANIGNRYAIFEPVHGSAPKYEGKNMANPIACFFAGCMMLDYLGEIKISQNIRTAISELIRKGQVTRDLGGKLSTTDFTNKIINRLRSNL